MDAAAPHTEWAQRFATRLRQHGTRLSPKEAIDQGMGLYAILASELAPEDAASLIAGRPPSRGRNADASAPLQRGTSEGDVRHGPCRLVVVEDDVGECNALKHCLETEGYAVWAVTSGLNGLALVAEHQPDALITDLKMRVMDGADLARVAKCYARRPLAVVMITGASAPEDLLRAETSGVDHLLRKPVRMADLVSLLPVARA